MLNRNIFYFFLFFFLSSSLKGCFFEFFRYFSAPQKKWDFYIKKDTQCYLTQLPIKVQNKIADYLIKYELEKKNKKEFLNNYEIHQAKGVMETIDYPVCNIPCVLFNKFQENDSATEITDFNVVSNWVVGLQLFEQKINNTKFSGSRLLVKHLESGEKTKIISIEKNELIEVFTVIPNGTKIFAIAKTHDEKKLLMFDKKDDVWQKQFFDIAKKDYKEIGYFPQDNFIGLLTKSNELEIKNFDQDSNKNLLEKYFHNKTVCKKLKALQ